MLLSVSILFSGCLFKKTAKGTNIKVNYTGTASVSFYPVCPACKHVSPSKSANVSDGEQLEAVYACENCYEVYKITIDRKNANSVLDFGGLDSLDGKMTLLTVLVFVASIGIPLFHLFFGKKK